ncbi:hypothetical protein HGRIS_005812 [Hohenbuehelia grisea]|uniref:Proteophosphoglycan ppg4 n=1 Tax=Hohenbuehelia grisea TaxID=104357 RepID=A0ABR3JY76_9AGAR
MTRCVDRLTSASSANISQSESYARPTALASYDIPHSRRSFPTRPSSPSTSTLPTDPLHPISTPFATLSSVAMDELVALEREEAARRADYESRHADALRRATTRPHPYAHSYLDAHAYDIPQHRSQPSSASHSRSASYGRLPPFVHSQSATTSPVSTPFHTPSGFDWEQSASRDPSGALMQGTHFDDPSLDPQPRRRLSGPGWNMTPLTPLDTLASASGVRSQPHSPTRSMALAAFPMPTSPNARHPLPGLGLSSFSSGQLADLASLDSRNLARGNALPYPATQTVYPSAQRNASHGQLPVMDGGNHRNLVAMLNHEHELVHGRQHAHPHLAHPYPQHHVPHTAPTRKHRTVHWPADDTPSPMSSDSEGERHNPPRNPGLVIRRSRRSQVRVKDEQDEDGFGAAGLFAQSDVRSTADASMDVPTSSSLPTRFGGGLAAYQQLGPQSRPFAAPGTLWTPSTSPFLGPLRNLNLQSAGPSRAPSPVLLPPSAHAGWLANEKESEDVKGKDALMLPPPSLPTPQLSSGPSSAASSPPATRALAGPGVRVPSEHAAGEASTVASRSGSRAGSPAPGASTTGAGLAHSVRLAFGMTPLNQANSSSASAAAGATFRFAHPLSASTSPRLAPSSAASSGSASTSTSPRFSLATPRPTHAVSASMSVVHPSPLGHQHAHPPRLAMSPPLALLTSASVPASRAGSPPITLAPLRLASMSAAGSPRHALVQLRAQEAKGMEDLNMDEGQGDVDAEGEVVEEEDVDMVVEEEGEGKKVELPGFREFAAAAMALPIGSAQGAAW